MVAEKEREAMELLEAAKKAAAQISESQHDGGSEESRCLDALNKLKAFPITVQILVSSQIGKLLRPLTKHARKNIKAVASEIIAEWKHLYLEQTKDNKNGTVHNRAPLKAKSLNSKTPKPHKPAIEVEKVSETEVVKVVKASDTEAVRIAKVSETETVKVEKTGRTATAAASEKVVKSETVVMNSLPKCNDNLRDKMREQLYEALCKVPTEASEDMQAQVNASDLTQVALSVEAALFEKWGRSNGSYKAKYRSLLFNIKDAKNPDFRRKVLLGHIKPEEIVNLSSEEMASDERQLENERIKRKALFDCELGGQPEATTDQFKCKRCGQRKTTYHQTQTRSADEPMTTYVTCVNCNNRWKFC